MDSKDKNVEKNKHFLMSVEFAVQGVKTVFEEERNMRKHVAFGILALFMGVIFQLDRIDYLCYDLPLFFSTCGFLSSLFLYLTYKKSRISVFIFSVAEVLQIDFFVSPVFLDFDPKF